MALPLMDSQYRIESFGRVNWLGMGTLYRKEVWRFMKVWSQTIMAPMMTTLLFLAILLLALGGGERQVGGIAFDRFIAPGLVMMGVMQNAFANTSSSLMLSKIQGVIVDILMPPITAGEMTFAYVMGGVTRGMLVGVSLMVAVYLFVPFTIHSPLMAIAYMLLASMLLSILGFLAGIVSLSFDHVAAFTNFIVSPLAFLSGTFYSIHQLPEHWRMVSYVNPFFYAIDGFRYAMTGVQDGSVVIGLITLLALNIMLWVLATRLVTSGWRLKS